MTRYIVVFILFLSTLNSSGMPSTYYKIKDVKAAKEYFFTFISKIAYTQNRYILDDREFVKSFYHLKNITPKVNKDFKRFIKIQKKYKLKSEDTLDKYLLHIDIIPVSLVIAQAAIESGWGKSRFMREANNVFGQWTWTEKGLVPKQRDEGKTHKIKIFPSIDAAVYGYMMNLNVGWAYKQLREVRAKIRKYGAPLSGKSLAKTLIHYSEKKGEYTRMLATMIIKNKLNRFDK